jgi:phospholipid/cholesterol/gamma-HCH transport system substrate-binding protein
MIGLFVIIGVLIGLIAIIWLGASKYFEKGGVYVTYFNESVQGLQVDSTVKYQGVDVGRVVKIRVAPDNTLIEVVMKIQLKGKLERDYVAQLKAVGITGIVFIELERKDPGEPDLSPKLNFASEYPIIASKPSEIKQILSGVQEVLENLKKIDTKGISEGIVSTVDNLNRVITRVDHILVEKKLGEIIDEVKNTLIKVQNLVSNIEGEIQAMNLAKTGTHLENVTARVEKIVASGEIEATIKEAREAIGKLNEWMERLDQRSLTVSNDVKVITENLRRSSESLELLLERVYASPSDLLFGQPPPPRRK